MTLEGAINLNETNDYVIYTMNSVTTGQYGVVVPKNINGTLNMLVDLHFKTSFDCVGNGIKTREELVEEIALEYSKVRNKYSVGMLVMPMLDESMFLNAVNNSDKQKMFDEVKKIGAITSELYKKLTDSGVEKNRIDQKIIMIEKKEEDIKFVNWLKEQMPNFVDGVFYSELDNNPIGTEEGTNNIFADVAPIPPVVATPEVTPSVVETVTIPVAPTTAPVAPVMNDIFATNATAEPVAPVVSTPEVAQAAPTVEAVTAPAVESAAPVAPTVAPVAPAMNDIFATNANETPVAPVVSTPEVAPVAPAMNDIFATNVNEAPVASVVSTPEVAPAAPVVEAVTAPAVEPATPVTAPVPPVAENAAATNDLFGAPVAPTSAPVNVSNNVDGPKPVESTSLDSTMTFTNVATQVNNTDEDASEDGVDDSNKSKGFVNLAILLAVIGVITFISIEIGKYLYNTFGA